MRINIITLFFLAFFGVSFSQETNTAKCKSGDCNNGSGILVFRDGSLYQGIFKEGKFNGKGKLTQGNGDVYDCQWLDGVPNGKGVIKLNDGSFQMGDFTNGSLTSGKMVDSNGNIREGRFKDGEIMGKGLSVYDGYTYDGYFKNNMPDGDGTLEYPNGDKFEGQWKDGQMNGPGVLKYVKGGIKKGIWVDNEYISGSDDTNAKNTISLQKNSGIYMIKCAVNGQELPMVFDTGASISSLQQDYLKTMYNNGMFDEDDIRGAAEFMDANGDVNKSAIINIKEFRIGDEVLHNIEVSVAESNAPNLLGLNVLNMLGKTLILDFSKNTLRYYK